MDASREHKARPLAVIGPRPARDGPWTGVGRSATPPFFFAPTTEIRAHRGDRPAFGVVHRCLQGAIMRAWHRLGAKPPDRPCGRA